jgi:biotin-(acetyl-CoA carboxylase) ligase
VHSLDDFLTRPFARDAILTDWRELSVHNPGDTIHCVIGERTLDGTWLGIDDHGRAKLRTADREIAVSAGDLFLA